MKAGARGADGESNYYSTLQHRWPTATTRAEQWAQDLEFQGSKSRECPPRTNGAAKVATRRLGDKTTEEPHAYSPLLVAAAVKHSSTDIYSSGHDQIDRL
jgi:hypothetical protein